MDSKIKGKLVNASSTSFSLSIPSRDLKEVVFAGPHSPRWLLPCLWGSAPASPGPWRAPQSSFYPLEGAGLRCSEYSSAIQGGLPALYWWDWSLGSIFRPSMLALDIQTQRPQCLRKQHILPGTLNATLSGSQGPFHKVPTQGPRREKKAFVLLTFLHS